MNAPTKRLRSLPRWLAGVYFVWALVVYLFADHAWWPMFLYPLIWPVSALWEHNLNSIVLSWLRPASGPVPSEIYILFDRISGVFYLVVGTFWLWCIASLLSRLATVLFPIQSAQLGNNGNAS